MTRRSGEFQEDLVKWLLSNAATLTMARHIVEHIRMMVFNGQVECFLRGNVVSGRNMV